MADTAPFEQLVMSGGGLRSFWQGGFVEVVREHLALAPDRLSSVSAGALSAVGMVARCGPRIRDRMARAFRETDANVSPPDDMPETGLTPHQQIYRDVVEDILDGDVLARVGAGPAFQVLIGHPPAAGAARLTGAAAAAAYEAELAAVSSPHMNWAGRLGAEGRLVDGRKAARDGTLADLVCAAAVIPPVFAPPTWQGRPVIDGGMIDQAPMPEPDRGRTLVLLTRRYRSIPEVAGRTYLAPSGELPVDKIDFTSPEEIDAAWAAGEADGRRYLHQGTLN
jgi:hypothetical protein